MLVVVVIGHPPSALPYYIPRGTAANKELCLEKAKGGLAQGSLETWNGESRNGKALAGSNKVSIPSPLSSQKSCPLISKADSLGKTLMLGKIEGRRRRG